MTNGDQLVQQSEIVLEEQSDEHSEEHSEKHSEAELE
jgi:hypothetical protein